MGGPWVRPRNTLGSKTKRLTVAGGLSFKIPFRDSLVLNFLGVLVKGE